MYNRIIPLNRFVFYFIITFLCLSFPILFNFIFLKNIGEYLKEDEIFEKQNYKDTGEVVYGSGIFNYITSLKLYSFKKKEPEIIALGSSRVLPFRESFFSKKFYNMGYTVSSINDLRNIVFNNELHKAKVILLGIDFWWFKKKNSLEKYFPDNGRQQNNIMPSHLILPWKWVFNGKVTLPQYVKYIFRRSENIGVRGEILNAGFVSDGSIYYTDIISGKGDSFKDIKFAATIENIRNSSNRFGHDENISNFYFNEFLKVLAFLSEKGANIILFLPPLPTIVNEEMQRFDYSYIEKFKKACLKNNISIYDFTNPKIMVDANDCEFIDGFHGGDVLYAKILLRLLKQEPLLSDYINRSYLEDVVFRYNGLAMIPNKNICINREIDFLQLGCSKSVTNQKP